MSEGILMTDSQRAGAPPEHKAQSDDARVVLTFPPQTIAKEKFMIQGDVARR
jgi:hypothetical protein